jgi:magnesium transporter
LTLNVSCDCNYCDDEVIRGLAVGTLNGRTMKAFLKKEFYYGLALSVLLGSAGCARALIFRTPMKETFAITSSLMSIVFISVSLGSLLPLAMKRVGIDPAHSSTSIQVIMDILGVSIVVRVSALVLGFHKTV